MESNQIFSLERLSLLLKRQLALNYKPALISLCAISGIVLVISLISSYTNMAYLEKQLIDFGFVLFMIVGFIFSSKMFDELHDRVKALLYLSLPASHFEKLIAGWIISAPAFAVVAVGMLSFISLVASSIATIYTDSSIQIFNPFNYEVLKSIGIYIITQSVFYFGALYFRKYNFIKTVFALFLFFAIMSSILGVLAWYLFHDFANYIPHGEVDMNIKVEQLNDVASFLFRLLMAPFFLLVAYFRLKEREV